MGLRDWERQRAGQRGPQGLATADEGAKLEISIVVYRMRGELHASRVHPQVPSSVANIKDVVFEVKDHAVPNEDNIFASLEQRAKNKARELGLGEIRDLTC